MPTRARGNYAALLSLLPDLASRTPGQNARLRAAGFMDLVVEVLGAEADIQHLSLAHYYVQNGDLMADPEMEVRVNHTTRTVDALTFQQAAPPLYVESYPTPTSISPRAHRENNAFLEQWLRNLRAQGHALSQEA